MWLFQRRNKDSHVQEENMEIGFVGMALIVGLLLIWFWNSIYIIKEWERGVVLRLGRLIPEAKGAGINLVFWPIETLYRINMRIETLDVPPQDIITRDNVSVKVNAVCYFRVVDANLALSQVQNYTYATSQLAQTTIRAASVRGCRGETSRHPRTDAARHCQAGGSRTRTPCKNHSRGRRV